VRVYVYYVECENSACILLEQLRYDWWMHACFGSFVHRGELYVYT
jgi:hypothetical protein